MPHPDRSRTATNPARRTGPPGRGRRSAPCGAVPSRGRGTMRAPPTARAGGIAPRRSFANRSACTSGPPATRPMTGPPATTSDQNPSAFDRSSRLNRPLMIASELGSGRRTGGRREHPERDERRSRPRQRRADDEHRRHRHPDQEHLAVPVQVAELARSGPGEGQGDGRTGDEPDEALDRRSQVVGDLGATDGEDRDGAGDPERAEQHGAVTIHAPGRCRGTPDAARRWSSNGHGTNDSSSTPGACWVSAASSSGPDPPGTVRPGASEDGGGHEAAMLPGARSDAPGPSSCWGGRLIAAAGEHHVQLTTPTGTTVPVRINVNPAHAQWWMIARASGRARSWIPSEGSAAGEDAHRGAACVQLAGRRIRGEHQPGRQTLDTRDDETLILEHVAANAPVLNRRSGIGTGQAPGDLEADRVATRQLGARRRIAPRSRTLRHRLAERRRAARLEPHRRERSDRVVGRATLKPGGHRRVARARRDAPGRSPMPSAAGPRHRAGACPAAGAALTTASTGDVLVEGPGRPRPPARPCRVEVGREPRPRARRRPSGTATSVGPERHGEADRLTLGEGVRRPTGDCSSDLAGSRAVASIRCGVVDAPNRAPRRSRSPLRRMRRRSRARRARELGSRTTTRLRSRRAGHQHHEHGQHVDLGAPSGGPSLRGRRVRPRAARPARTRSAGSRSGGRAPRRR